VQLTELLLRDLDLLQRGRDLVECQIATFLAVGNEAAQLLQLVDRCPISQQNLVVDASTLPWVAPASCTFRLPNRPHKLLIANVSDSTRILIRQA